MNLGAIVRRGIHAVPGSIRCSATFTRVIPGTYDKTTDLRAGDVSQQFTAPGVLDSVRPDQLPAGTSADEIARLSDFTVAALDCPFKPSPTDSTCVINGETWRVINNDDTDPSGASPLLYVVRLRR